MSGEYKSMVDKPSLVQPVFDKDLAHQIPPEIQPGLPLRQFIIMERCPACGVTFSKKAPFELDLLTFFPLF